MFEQNALPNESQPDTKHGKSQKDIKASFWTDFETQRPLEKVTFALAVAGLLISVLGLAGVIAVLFRTSESNSFIYLFACQNAAVIITLALLFNRERSLRDRADRRRESEMRHFGFVFSKLASKFHNINHEKRDLMNRVETDAREIPAEETARVLSRFCDEIADLFQSIFADDHLVFHVAIKGIVDSDGHAKHLVATLAREKEQRSHGSYRVKDEDKEPHTIFGNTAFERLMSSGITDFTCDDLSNSSSYANTSRTWKSRYNATMVVPIRRNHVEKEDVFEIVGFIGIDCLKSGEMLAVPVFCNALKEARLELKDILL